MVFWKAIFIGLLIWTSFDNVLADEKLQAPSPLALPGYIHLVLFDRVCDHEYRVERSFDQKAWISLGTIPFFTNSMMSPDMRQCENDFVDSLSIPRGTKAVYYRYMEMEGYKIVHVSKIGVMDMLNDKDAEDYWGS